MSIETYHTVRGNTFKLSRDYCYVNKPGACYYSLFKNNSVGQIGLLYIKLIHSRNEGNCSTSEISIRISGWQ